MIKGKSYLVITVGDTSKFIQELECLEVSHIAYKVQNKIKERYSLFSLNTSDPYWMLKTDIDEIGQTKHQIIDKIN